MLSSDVLVPASGLAAANARLILNHTRSHPSLTPFFDRHRDTSSLRSVCSLQDLDELSLDPLLEFWSLVALSLEDGPDYVCFTRPLITQNGAQMLNAELTTYASINALRELLLGVQPPLAFAEAWPDLSSACRSFWSHAIQNGSEAREILLEGSAKIAFSNSPLLEPVRPMAPAFNLSPEELSAAAQTILSSEALSKAFAASRFTGLVDADLFPAQLSDARASQSLCAILSAYGAAHATAAAVIWAIAAGSATQASPQKEGLSYVRRCVTLSACSFFRTALDQLNAKYLQTGLYRLRITFTEDGPLALVVSVTTKRYVARKRLGLLRWNAPAECSSTRSEDPTHSLAAELVEFSKFLVERAIVKNFQEAEKLLCTPMWSLARARSAKTAKQKVAALAEARREFSAARAKFTSAPAPDQKPAGDISLARLTGPVGFETQPLKASSPTPPPPEPADTPLSDVSDLPLKVNMIQRPAIPAIPAFSQKLLSALNSGAEKKALSLLDRITKEQNVLKRLAEIQKVESKGQFAPSEVTAEGEGKNKNSSKKSDVRSSLISDIGADQQGLGAAKRKFDEYTLFEDLKEPAVADVPDRRLSSRLVSAENDQTLPDFVPGQGCPFKRKSVSRAKKQVSFADELSIKEFDKSAKPSAVSCLPVLGRAPST